MGTSAGSGTNGSGTGNAPDSTGSGSPGAGSGGGQGTNSGSANSGNAPGAGTIDREKLNPLIRNMPEEQVNELFDTMFNALKTRQNDDSMSGVPAHARPQLVLDEPKAPTADEIREAFDTNSEKFNPQDMVKKIVASNYGGLLEDIGRNANSGLKAELRNMLPDFKDYEADVDQVVSALPASQVNQGTYLQAYFTAKGLRATQAEIRERAKPPTTTRPSAQVLETDAPKLSAEDEQVARVMFRGSADPIAEYHKATKAMSNQQIRVPGDPPRSR